MYVGRIVALGVNRVGQPCALYRVSSRSFPNREAKVLSDAIAILPKPGFEQDIYKNPYIAYNCLRLVGPHAVVTNGSHTDPVAAKLADGASPRDALVSVLSGMDFEHDSLDTPRIAAIIDRTGEYGHLGIVTRSSLLVRGLPLTRGQAYYVATYEHTVPGEPYVDRQFDVADPADACSYILGRGVFAQLERPVTAACAVADAHGQFHFAVASATPPAAQ